MPTHNLPVPPVRKPRKSAEVQFTRRKRPCRPVRREIPCQDSNGCQLLTACAVRGAGALQLPIYEPIPPLGRPVDPKILYFKVRRWHNIQEQWSYRDCFKRDEGVRVKMYDARFVGT